jgi:hypothetical protein
MLQASLLHYTVGGVPGLDLGIDREWTLGMGGAPDVVIPVTASVKPASALFEGLPHCFAVVVHSRPQANLGQLL